MIEAKGVTKSYGLGESKTDVLKGIDLRISDGDFAVILGASGSGKSTLLNCLSGLERVDGGSIEYLAFQCGFYSCSNNFQRTIIAAVKHTDKILYF